MPVVEPCTELGPINGSVVGELGIVRELMLSAVGSPDAASASIGSPLDGDDGAYISCGTWSPVGVELSHPVVTDAARIAGFTNGAGVDGRVRLLKNLTGLSLLSESLRSWQRECGGGPDALLAEATGPTGETPVFDADNRARDRARQANRIMAGAE